MSAPILREHSNNLFNCLQRKFWLCSNGQPWKNYVESLATSVSDYALYLQEQNKKIEHFQLHTARQISDNMSLVLLLPVNQEPQNKFLTLDEELGKQKEFEYLTIEDFCPKKYHLFKIYSQQDFPSSQ